MSDSNPLSDEITEAELIAVAAFAVAVEHRKSEIAWGLMARGVAL
jgi:hypothetical protein